MYFFFFFFNDTATTEIYTLSLHDALPIYEVVVVGYGAQKKVNLTGAVANVNVQEAIASRPVTDAAKALQGITPGLTITNKIGGVGTESTIKLRGSIGSLSATEGTSPLILVDNVEVPNLNVINPDDIETISVLKDAASASIYGTRAAWGVILITTKQGKKNNKVSVTYSNNFAWNTPTKTAELASELQSRQYHVCRLLLESKKRPSTSSSRLCPPRLLHSCPSCCAAPLGRSHLFPRIRIVSARPRGITAFPAGFPTS